MNFSEYYPELFSVFFTNQILNGVYNAAEANVVAKKYTKLSEAYRHGLADYQRAISDPPNRVDHFKEILKNLHVYVMKEINSLLEGEGKADVKIMYTDFLDTVAVFLLPKEAYAEVANNFRYKQQTIRNVLGKTVTRFVIYITDAEMNFVLSTKERQNQANSERCCDKFKEFLQDEIHKLGSIIMAKNAGVEVKSPSDANKMMVGKLQQALQTVLTEKAELEKKVNGAQQFIAVLKNTIAERDRTIETLQKQRNPRQPYRPPNNANNIPIVPVIPIPNQNHEPNQNQNHAEFNPPNLDELGDLEELSESI